MTRHATLPTLNHIGISVGIETFTVEGRGPLRRMKRGPVPGLDYFAEKAVPAAGRDTRERGSGPGRKSVSTHRSPQGMVGAFAFQVADGQHDAVLGDVENVGQRRPLATARPRLVARETS